MRKPGLLETAAIALPMALAGCNGNVVVDGNFCSDPSAQLQDFNARANGVLIDVQDTIALGEPLETAGGTVFLRTDENGINYDAYCLQTLGDNTNAAVLFCTLSTSYPTGSTTSNYTGIYTVSAHYRDNRAIAPGTAFEPDTISVVDQLNAGSTILTRNDKEGLLLNGDSNSEQVGTWTVIDRTCLPQYKTDFGFLDQYLKTLLAYAQEKAAGN